MLNLIINSDDANSAVYVLNLHEPMLIDTMDLHHKIAAHTYANQCIKTLGYG